MNSGSFCILERIKSFFCTNEWTVDFVFSDTWTSTACQPSDSFTFTSTSVTK